MAAPTTDQVDALVVGGGPAGLSAALVLCRQRRRVLLVDGGEPRNAPADEVHMVLSRDGFSPAMLREIGREQLGAYPTVDVRTGVVSTISPAEEGFAAEFDDGNRVQSRGVILATGQVDILSDVDGLWERFGRGVFHCPFCHGYETRDRPIAVLGGDFAQVMQAVYVADRFSDDVVLCTDGVELTATLADAVAERGIGVRTERVVRIEGEPDDLTVSFDSGPPLRRGAVYYRPPTAQHARLAEKLGCELLPDGCVRVDEFQRTTVPMVFAAGDMARLPGMPVPMTFVIMAAADGTRAAIWLDNDLFRADARIPMPEPS